MWLFVGQGFDRGASTRRSRNRGRLKFKLFARLFKHRNGARSIAFRRRRGDKNVGNNNDNLRVGVENSTHHLRAAETMAQNHAGNG